MGCLGSVAKLKPTRLAFVFSSVSPGLVVILHHQSLDPVLLGRRVLLILKLLLTGVLL